MQNDKDNNTENLGADNAKEIAADAQPEEKNQSEQNTKNLNDAYKNDSTNTKNKDNITENKNNDNVEDNVDENAEKADALSDASSDENTEKTDALKDTANGENAENKESEEPSKKDDSSDSNKEKESEGAETNSSEDNSSKETSAAPSNEGKDEKDSDDNIIHSDSSGEKKDNIEEVKKGESGYNGVKTEDEEEEEDDGKKPFRVLRGIIYTVCILLFSILLAVIIILSITDYLGMFRPYKSANVRIPKKASISQVADILQDKGIIRSSLLFKISEKGSAQKGLQDGTFTLNSNMSFNEIVKTLKSSKNRSTVNVTIPEGYSVAKIADLLEQKEVCKKDDFLAAANSDKIEFDFQKDIPADSKRLYRLEGYLFPDTYEFYLDTPADTVVKKMLTTFDKRVDKDVRDKIKKSGMSVDDAVKLASVIQAETGGSKEMANVSSVFHNRLKNGYQGNKMLQSDVTVLYGKNFIEPTITDKTEAEKLSNSYNTYKVTGLPAGAINNPGIAAIKAAVSPSNTNYYFFVTDKKGNYYYARTYSQHKLNCEKALKNGGAVGTDTK